MSLFKPNQKTGVTPLKDDFSSPDVGLAMDPNANLAPKTDPKSMNDFISVGMQVLDKADKIPKALIKACAGIILLSGQEGGVFVSFQGAAGVAMAHKDGKWSAPIAVNSAGVGGGAVIGYAEKQSIILLNHFAMDKLLKGSTDFSIGVDAGFAAGKTGRAAAGDIAVSTKGGLGTSFVYTFSKGALLNVEAVMGMRLNPPNKPMEDFYGTSNNEEILEGKATVPEGSAVPALHEKLEGIANAEDAAE